MLVPKWMPNLWIQSRMCLVRAMAAAHGVAIIAAMLVVTAAEQLRRLALKRHRCSDIVRTVWVKKAFGPFVVKRR
ncbi:MAG: hypothetical protein A4E47_00595 [Methanosaeta sp. PtaU1.Bin028]|nr:MAG: hypothetical protein A4E47_00595 [Methanosaeta sp. PtaU1.Bin028]